MAELAPHARYEKPCTGGPPWPPRFPTPYSAFSAESLALVPRCVPGRFDTLHSLLFAFEVILAGGIGRGGNL